MTRRVVVWFNRRRTRGATGRVTVARCIIACATVMTLAAATSVSAAPPARPLETAFVDPDAFIGPEADAALRQAKAAGATVIKVPLVWSLIAPTTRRAGFNPSNPSDPSYNWAQLDTQLRLIRRHGLEPVVYVAAAKSERGDADQS